jgi:hypothetical protein
MHRFAIRQKNDSKVAILHLRHLDPPANMAISLHVLAKR